MYNFNIFDRLKMDWKHIVSSPTNNRLPHAALIILLITRSYAKC